jgi:hypothetical protein
MKSLRRGGRRSCRGLADPVPGALLSGRDQECGNSKQLHPAGQTTRQGHLETSVCPTPPPFFFVARLHFEYVSFSYSSSSSGATTTTGTAFPVIGTTAAEKVVEVTPWPATDGEPQTPKGVPKDALEKLEEEVKMAPESVLVVVLEDVPAEGDMIAVCVAAPSPSHGALAPSSPAPRIAAAWVLHLVRDWIWSQGIPPLMRRMTCPWARL